LAEDCQLRSLELTRPGRRCLTDFRQRYLMATGQTDLVP